MVGTVSITWNGVGADGDVVSTGDYIVKAQVTQGSSTSTLSKVLTVILQQQNLLGSVRVYPMPATNVLYFDLTQVTQGLGVEIRVWNVAGQLVRTLYETSGPQAKIAWNLTTTGGKDLSNGIYFAALTTQSSDPSLQDKCFVKFVVNGR